MVGANLVRAQTYDQYGFEQEEPASDILHQVQSSVVGPMNVLEDEHGGLGRVLKGRQHCRK